MTTSLKNKGLFLFTLIIVLITFPIMGLLIEIPTGSNYQIFSIIGLLIFIGATLFFPPLFWAEWKETRKINAWILSFFTGTFSGFYIMFLLELIGIDMSSLKGLVSFPIALAIGWLYSQTVVSLLGKSLKRMIQNQKFFS